MQPIKINQHLEGDTDYEDNEDNKDDDVSEKDNQINRDEIKVWNEEVKELLNERRSTQIITLGTRDFSSADFSVTSAVSDQSQFTLPVRRSNASF